MLALWPFFFTKTNLEIHSKYTFVMDTVHGAPLSHLLPGPWFMDRVHNIVHANLQYSHFSYIKLNHCCIILEAWMWSENWSQICYLKTKFGKFCYVLNITVSYQSKNKSLLFIQSIKGEAPSVHCNVNWTQYDMSYYLAHKIYQSSANTKETQEESNQAHMATLWKQRKLDKRRCNLSLKYNYYIDGF